MTDYRVLITGSRDWPYPDTVYRFLDHHLGLAIENSCTRMVVVHGGAAGTDTYARYWVCNYAQDRGILVVDERYRPEYGKYPVRVAPLKRNQVMVGKGADVCGAFRYRMSRGTTDCMNRAAGAGIPVALFDEVEEE